MQPLNFFSHKSDPAGVLAVLRKFGDVTVDGDGHQWTKATVRWKTGFLRKHSVTVGHNVEYYREPEWSQQMLGMLNYFSDFPKGPNRENALQMIRSFRFALSLPGQKFDLSKRERDPRLPVVFALAEHLDAALFQPGYLLDGTGRVLLGPEGECDPAAILPLTSTQLGWCDPDDAGDNETNKEDDYEFTPPDAQKVVRRALVLAAVTARALTERDNVDDIEGFRAELNDWVTDLGLDNELEPQEKAFLAHPGVPDDQALLNAAWRVEGLSVLGWALGLTELPGYDELVIPMDLWKAFGLFRTEEARNLIETAELESETEIERMRCVLLAFHWRLTDFRVNDTPMDFSAVIAQGGWFSQFDISSFELADNDLALQGAAISEADPGIVSEANSIAMERHLAINWLCDAQAPYSETDVST